jgi:low temperature requirement protein LtrA
MTRHGPGRLGGTVAAVPGEEGDRVTTLELFFDLAFVFAFTQLSRLMAQEHDAMGVLQALVVLALLWWSWASYGWLGNLAHADEGIVRIVMIVAMSAMFVVALVVLEAYEDLPGGLFAPLVFVGAYLVARITHAIVFAAVSVPALRKRALLTASLSVVPSGVLLTTGALLGSPWQVWLALAAVALEPLITHRMSEGVDWRVSSTTHFTERHGLIVILALGESIIAIGVGVAKEPMSLSILGGALLAVAISVGLWWAYFSRLARPAEAALARRPDGDRARTARDGYTYLHLVLVAGIVIAALGLEEALAHIEESEPLGLFGAGALGGGVACYLAGTVFFARRVIGGWRIPRLVASAVVLASVPLLAVLTPVGALAAVVTMLVAVLVLERGHSRQESAAI